MDVPAEAHQDTVQAVGNVLASVGDRLPAFSVGDIDPASAVSDRSRQAEEYIGYTWYHLPVLNWRPDRPNSVDAMFAIFAARMAFSSLEIRS